MLAGWTDQIEIAQRQKARAVPGRSASPAAHFSFTRLFDTVKRVARVGGDEPCDVLRLAQGDGLGERPLEIFPNARPMRSADFLGVAAMSQKDFESGARRKLSSFAARPSGPSPMIRKSRILVTMTSL